MKNVDFQFKGFQPEKKFQDYVDKKCQTLFLTVPSDAFPKGFVEKKGVGYTGSVEVISAQGTFSVEAEGKEPQEVFSKLYASLKRDLTDWHKKRFL